MSYFSTELVRILDEEFHGHQLRMAKRAGLSQSILSRQCSGICLPDMGTLEKLLDAVSPKARGPLLKSFLLDQCPSSYRSKFKMTTGSTKANVQTTKDCRIDLSELPPAMQRAVFLFIRQAKENPQASDFIVSTARFLENQ